MQVQSLVLASNDLQLPVIDGDVSDLPVLFPVVTKRGVKVWATLFNWNAQVGRYNVLVPKHSFTNFASIPFFARWLISQTDHAIVIPAIIHDHLVNEFGKVEDIQDGEIKSSMDINMTWAEKARVFLDYSKTTDSITVRIKCRIVYVSVRGYGIFKRKK